MMKIPAFPCILMKEPENFLAVSWNSIYFDLVIHVKKSYGPIVVYECA